MTFTTISSLAKYKQHAIGAKCTAHAIPDDRRFCSDKYFGVTGGPNHV